MRGPLLQALGSATSADHGALERLLPSWHAVSRAEYAAYLTALAGFQLPLEQRLFDAHDWVRAGLPDADRRRRAGLLRADLEALGIETSDRAALRVVAWR